MKSLCQIIALVALSLAVQASLTTSALACSDAGPPNSSCNDGGAAWIACGAHADCPTGQLCGVGGTCQCYACAYGEACTGDACRCAPQEVPDAGPECTIETNSCGVYSVRCPEMDAGPPRCSTDGATQRACTVDSDCEGAPFSGAGSLVCTARGVCDCGESGPSGGDGGCSVARGGRGASPAILTVLVGLALAARRRR